MTTNISPADFLTTAKAVVNDAARLLQAAFGDVTATRKADGSLVTDADHAADAAISHALAQQFAHHAILSEEGNTWYDPAVDYTWVIDPLDGTTNFARGLPLWGISVALLFQGEPIVGVLAFPMLGVTYSALRHGGAWRNDQPLTTDPMTAPDDQHFLVTCTRTPRRYRVTTPLKVRILGSAAYHVATVAEGSALAGIEATPKLWDVAAALLILTEAGGAYALLQQQEPLFPLPPQRHDYRSHSLPLVTACNRDVLMDVLTNTESLV